jgi:putative ABC transport system ATP-binding protein
MTLLHATAVGKQYGRTRALDEIDLTLAAGEVLAITGPSGSGKSTLLLCLSGIATPDTGEVWFAGVRLDDRSEAARAVLRRTEIGILLQHGQLVPELTAAENVALPLMLNGAKRSSTSRSAAE